MQGNGIGALEVRELDETVPHAIVAPVIVKFKEEQGDEWYPLYHNVSGADHKQVAVSWNIFNSEC